MKVRKLTAADVCEVTGYNRDRLRGLLKELPEWSVAPAERMARSYSARDLIVLCVVHKLETVLCTRRKAIASVFRQLQSALSGPKPISAGARLVITFEPPRVEYYDEREISVLEEGVILSLQPILDQVDHYLGAGQVLTSTSQANLRLGPGLVRPRRRRGAAS
jgi:hypothetical protein